METWLIIIAIVIIITIIVTYFAREYRRAKYGNVRFGYFTTGEHPVGYFPVTGGPLLVAKFNGRYMVAKFDTETRQIAPLFARITDAYSGYIVVSGMNDNVTPGENKVALHICATKDENIVETNLAIFPDFDGETGLPLITVGESRGNVAIWRFNPIPLISARQMRSVFGQTARGVFAEMPATAIPWVANDPILSRIKPHVQLICSFANVKYPELAFPTSKVKLEQWGNGFALTDYAAQTSIAVMPTSEPMVFRIFDLTRAALGSDGTTLENYTQLVATNGTAYDFSKNVIDTDSARWKLVLPPGAENARIRAFE